MVCDKPGRAIPAFNRIGKAYSSCLEHWKAVNDMIEDDRNIVDFRSIFGATNTTSVRIRRSSGGIDYFDTTSGRNSGLIYIPRLNEYFIFLEKKEAKAYKWVSFIDVINLNPRLGKLMTPEMR